MAELTAYDVDCKGCGRRFRVEMDRAAMLTPAMVRNEKNEPLHPSWLGVEAYLSQCPYCGEENRIVTH